MATPGLKSKPYTPPKLGFPHTCPAVPTSPRFEEEFIINDLQYSGASDDAKCRAYSKLAKLAKDNLDQSNLQKDKIVEHLALDHRFTALSASTQENIKATVRGMPSDSDTNHALKNLEVFFTDPRAKQIAQLGRMSESSLITLLVHYPSGTERFHQLWPSILRLQADPGFQPMANEHKDRVVRSLIWDQRNGYREEVADRLISTFQGLVPSADSPFHSLTPKLKHAVLYSCLSGNAKYTSTVISWLGSKTGVEAISRIAADRMDIHHIANAVEQLVGAVKESALLYGKYLQPSEASEYLKTITKHQNFGELQDKMKDDLIAIAQIPSFRYKGQVYSTSKLLANIVTSESFRTMTYNEKGNLIDEFASIELLAKGPAPHTRISLESVLKPEQLENFVRCIEAFEREEPAPTLSKFIRTACLGPQPKLRNPHFHPLQFAGNVSQEFFDKSIKLQAQDIRHKFQNRDGKEVELDAVRYTGTLSTGKVVEIVAPKNEIVGGNKLPPLSYIVAGIKLLPAYLQRPLNRVILTPFESGRTIMDADSRDGTVRTFQFEPAKKWSNFTEVFSSLLHEGGHLCSLDKDFKLKFSRFQKWRYERAMKSDRATVSGYGEEGGIVEDVAEAIATYNLAKANRDKRVFEVAEKLYAGRFEVLESAGFVERGEWIS